MIYSGIQVQTGIPVTGIELRIIQGEYWIVNRTEYGYQASKVHPASIYTEENNDRNHRAKSDNTFQRDKSM